MRLLKMHFSRQITKNGEKNTNIEPGRSKFNKDILLLMRYGEERGPWDIGWGMLTPVVGINLEYWMFEINSFVNHHFMI